jgi:hypothetical protein
MQQHLIDFINLVLDSGLINLCPGALTEFDLVIRGANPDQVIHGRLSITVGPVPYEVVHGEGPFDVNITFHCRPIG